MKPAMKVHLRAVVGLLAAGFLFSTKEAAGGEMAKETVAAIKDATVFVKMNFKVPGFRELIPASGSGFLFKTDGKKGYVVSSFYILGGHDLWPELRAASPDPTVVFFSGTKKEKVLKAEQVEVDFERRLAVFRVDNLPTYPSRSRMTPAWNFSRPCRSSSSAFRSATPLPVPRRTRP